MKFSRIDSSDELKRFLEKKGCEHGFVYHYTTFEKLKCILSSKRWRFGNASKMNDLHEYMVKGSNSEKWDRTFSTCFSFGNEDNIAMWSMYGIPWEDAIRIRITKTFLNNDEKTIAFENITLHDICYYLGYFGERRVLTDCPLHRDVCLPDCDICPEKALHWWSQRNKQTYIVEDNSRLKEELIGYVKNAAWEYEKETRLDVSLSSQSSGLYDYIELPIGDDFINEIHISLGPRSGLTVDDVKKKIAEIIYHDENQFQKIHNVSESYYKRDGLLSHLKRHCDLNANCVFSSNNNS